MKIGLKKRFGIMRSWLISKSKKEGAAEKMKEHYLPQKVIDLFHMKHPETLKRMEAEAAVSRIMNAVHSEIFLANDAAERRLIRKIENILREVL
jgi:hypothetical protein